MDAAIKGGYPNKIRLENFFGGVRKQYLSALSTVMVQEP